jgi:hypothetical protein
MVSRCAAFLLLLVTPGLVAGFFNVINKGLRSTHTCRSSRQSIVSMSSIGAPVPIDAELALYTELARPVSPGLHVKLGNRVLNLWGILYALTTFSIALVSQGLRINKC